MNDKPALVGIALCERILQDVFRKDAVTLVNVHNGISSQAFPTLVPVLYAFAQLTASRNPFSYQFKIVDPKGQVLAASNAGQVEPLPVTTALHKVISAFPALVFPEEGTYKVVLEIDGAEVGSIPFQVDTVAAPQPVA